MAKTITNEQMDDLARIGAGHRIQEIKAELKVLESFLDVTPPTAASPRKRRKVLEEKPQRKRRISKATRAAISKRMKNYWAEQRRLKLKKAS